MVMLLMLVLVSRSCTHGLLTVSNEILEIVFVGSGDKKTDKVFVGFTWSIVGDCGGVPLFIICTCNWLVAHRHTSNNWLSLTRISCTQDSSSSPSSRDLNVTEGDAMIHRKEPRCTVPHGHILATSSPSRIDGLKIANVTEILERKKKNK